MVGCVAISQAEKRDQLLTKIPSKQGNDQIQWVWAGMMIELEQYVMLRLKGLGLLSYTFRHTLRADVKALQQNPSSEDKAQIQDRRRSLQTQIEAFHQQALHYVRSDIASIARSSLNRAPEVPEADLEESDDETFFLGAGPELEEEDAEIPIEQVRLWLPSTFTKSERAQMGLGQVTEVEAELREGQANDALEALREGLAEKSLRFRTQVKPARGQKTMTRAWDSIHRADKEIRGAVRCYRLARNALNGLGVSNELLGRYQEIQKKDLKMSRDIVEENRVGQRSSELPWFWRLDGKWDRDRGEFLKECEHYYLGWWLVVEAVISPQSTESTGYVQKQEKRGGRRKWCW